MLPIISLKKILGAYSALTKQVEVHIRHWPEDDQEIFPVLTELVELQKKNMRVFALQKALEGCSGELDSRLQEQVYSFLRDEKHDMPNKLGCLYVADIDLGVFQYILSDIYEQLPEPREVCFLLSDMYAFPVAGYAKYRSIIEPIVAAYRKKITISPIDHTDSIRAHANGCGGIELTLAFAEALMKEVLRVRQMFGLSDAMNIGIGISYGKCNFDLLGEPEPNDQKQNDCAWYQAAKLMKYAERLCKHMKDKGGVIVVSDAVAQCTTGKVSKRLLSEFDSSWDNVAINLYDHSGTNLSNP